MTELITEDGQTIKNHGWRVAFAGMGINLALGVLYTWSVISSCRRQHRARRDLANIERA